jgi:hypothetical protein
MPRSAPKEKLSIVRAYIHPYPPDRIPGAPGLSQIDKAAKYYDKQAERQLRDAADLEAAEYRARLPESEKRRNVERKRRAIHVAPVSMQSASEEQQAEMRRRMENLQSRAWDDAVKEVDEEE